MNAFGVFFFLHAQQLRVGVCRLADTVFRHSKGMGMALFENTESPPHYYCISMTLDRLDGPKKSHKSKAGSLP